MKSRLKLNYQKIMYKIQITAGNQLELQKLQYIPFSTRSMARNAHVNLKFNKKKHKKGLQTFQKYRIKSSGKKVGFEAHRARRLLNTEEKRARLREKALLGEIGV